MACNSASWRATALLGFRPSRAKFCGPARRASAALATLLARLQVRSMAVLRSGVGTPLRGMAHAQRRPRPGFGRRSQAGLALRFSQVTGPAARLRGLQAGFGKAHLLRQPGLAVRVELRDLGDKHQWLLRASAGAVPGRRDRPVPPSDGGLHANHRRLHSTWATSARCGLRKPGTRPSKKRPRVVEWLWSHLAMASAFVLPLIDTAFCNRACRR